jgi:predicted N-acyltransferase
MDKDRFSGYLVKEVLRIVPIEYHRDIINECLIDTQRHSLNGRYWLSIEDYAVLKELMDYESPVITTVGDITKAGL